MNKIEAFEKAKVNLVLDNPFFGSLLMEARIVITEEIPTMAVDGGETIYVNPKFLSALRVKEIEGCLAHEVLHLALRHFAREEGRERKKWNIATDLAINSFLKGEGFHLPRGGAFPSQFGLEEGLSAEEYYNKLKDLPAEGGFDEHIYGECASSSLGDSAAEEMEEEGRKEKGKEREKGKKGGEGSGKEKEGGREKGAGSKKNKDKDRGLYKEKKEEQEGGDESREESREKDLAAKWQNALVRAATVARLHQGKLPGGAQSLIEALFKPRLNWKELLRDFVSSTIVIGGVDWFRPDRRFLQSGIILPSRREKRIEIIIAVDTSGSISDKELTIFFSEINSILRSAGHYSVYLVQCDADIQDIKEINFPETLDVKKVHIKGRGGTDFRPVFEWAIRNCRRPLIYFTDLCGTFPEYFPPFPVLWVTVGDGKAPFGRVIKMEEVK